MLDVLPVPRKEQPTVAEMRPLRDEVGAEHVGCDWQQVVREEIAALLLRELQVAVDEGRWNPLRKSLRGVERDDAAGVATQQRALLEAERVHDLNDVAAVEADVGGICIKGVGDAVARRVEGEQREAVLEAGHVRDEHPRRRWRRVQHQHRWTGSRAPEVNLPPADRHHVTGDASGIHCRSRRRCVGRVTHRTRGALLRERGLGGIEGGGAAGHQELATVH
jgi:hypothetical protein